MSCTTILVGKDASYDGSTMIARNHDACSGSFVPHKFVVVHKNEQPRKYQSKIGKLEIDLPDNPMQYTALPRVIQNEGIWGGCGVNEAHVAMTSTETITSNERVLGADPLVNFVPGKGCCGTGSCEIHGTPGGIGEEDFLTMVLPYIKSAREGVLRLGSLLEKYGTYEMNAVAFQDKDEIWWLESIGGHHWMAKRVPDDAYVTMPNQLGIDSFDIEDAFGEKKEHICSDDLREFIKDNHLDLTIEGEFNPRRAFGSHSDADHTYNTPRAWVMQRYFNPTTNFWDGPDADFTPTDDDIPWARRPENKITVEDVKYILSNHFQGTPYDPYGKYGDPSQRGMYRVIGINRNNHLDIVQLRPYMPKEISSIQWISYACNVFNASVPFYSCIDTAPEYLSNTTERVDSNSFYWANRLISALTDAHYSKCIGYVEQYQLSVQSKGHELLNKFDKKFLAEKPANVVKFCEDANKEIEAMVKEQTDKLLLQVLDEASNQMKNAFARSDA